MTSRAYKIRKGGRGGGKNLDNGGEIKNWRDLPQ